MSDLIWCSRLFSNQATLLLERAVHPRKVIWSADRMESNLFQCTRDPALLNKVAIAFGQPHLDDCFGSKSLKWIQLTTAGYTRYDRDDLRESLRSRSVQMTNSSGVYNEPCAQHLLGMMLSANRMLPKSLHAQIKDQSWNYLKLRSQSRLLNGQSIGILGFGAIAKRLVELLSPMRPSIIAFRRTVRGDESCRTLPIDQFDSYAGRFDHVVNILPAAAGTKDFFEATRLSKLRPGAKFYNIGRGDTVDQNALVDALKSNAVSAAYLDVSTPEPLPPDHPLWRLPNCFITPHTAGGFDTEPTTQVEHFVQNLSRFDVGQPLLDQIN